MSHFKKGDRVIYTGNLSPHHKGRTGTVIDKTTTGNVQVEWDDKCTPHWTPANNNLTMISTNPPVPVKRPSEVILEKLIEAKRELQEADRAHGLAYDRKQAAIKAVNVVSAQLQSAITKEIAS